ncbi:9733_t:CDS:2, partial [Cetraspora pellucida]
DIMDQHLDGEAYYYFKKLFHKKQETMDSQFTIENWRYDPNCDCIDCSHFKIRNHSRNCECIDCLRYNNPSPPQILYQYEQHQQLTFNASTTEAQHTDQNRLEIVPQFNQAQQLMQQHPSNVSIRRNIHQPQSRHYVVGQTQEQVFPPQQIVSNQFPPIQQQDLAFHITNPHLGVINNRPEAPPPQNTNRINGTEIDYPLRKVCYGCMMSLVNSNFQRCHGCSEIIDNLFKDAKDNNKICKRCKDSFIQMIGITVNSKDICSRCLEILKKFGLINNPNQDTREDNGTIDDSNQNLQPNRFETRVDNRTTVLNTIFIGNSPREPGKIQ